jgi:hypothetical protein
VAVSDTTPEAADVHLKALQTLSGERRLLTALEISDLVRELARTRIRLEHPTWTESEIVRELLRMAFLPGPLPAGLP